MDEQLADQHTVRTRVLLGNLTAEQRRDLVYSLYDSWEAVRQSNPHDGRTVAGRAWSEASYEVLRIALANLQLGEA